jgi:hypothetical protein
MTGNAQRAAGGLNQITIPMQGQSMVQGSYTGYGGGFNSPVNTPGIQNGLWNLAYWFVPVPVFFGETVLQATDREISIVKARMNDVYAVTAQQMGSAIFTNNTANEAGGLYSLASDVTVRGCTFTANNAAGGTRVWT